MKFYEIRHPDGRAELVGTLAETKGHKFLTVEVPTDKDGLKGRINELLWAIHNAEFVDRETQSTIHNEPSVSQTINNEPSVASKIIEQMDRPKQATQLFEHDDIVELIVDSKGFQLANYFSAVMEAAKRVQKETEGAISRQPAG